VGKTTFEKSINCLKPRGYMVLYGNASGPVTEFNPATLAARGSLYLTRPTLVNYISDRESLDKRSGDIFRWIADGKLKLRIEHCFPLSEVQEAHTELEGRKTTGKVILLP
jgi:NADPH2:quinone reductase